MKASGGLLVDLSYPDTKIYANHLLQTCKLGVTRGKLKVEFTEDLYDKLETTDTIESLCRIVDGNKLVDFSIDAGNGV